MADQIESPKVVAYAITGSGPEAASAKVVAYFILVSDDSSGGDDSGRQGHVHSQIIRRRR